VALFRPGERMERWWNDTDRGSEWSVGGMILTGGANGALVE
jgi:hypothetical protein